MTLALEIALTLAGICVPSLLIASAVRRWVVSIPWSIAGLFLLLTLGFLGGAVFTSRVPVPVDEVARGYPHRGVVGDVEVGNPLTNDTSRLFLPWMKVVREELRAGHVPLWNRYAFSGYPLLANGESAPFYPPFLATLFVPLPKQIVAMAGIKIFCALLFTYLFLRRERVSPAAAIFGASCFAFSVFQTVYLYYSTTAVTALLPAALFAVLHLFDHPRSKGAFWFCAIVVAVLQTAGHPESVLHVAVACIVMLLIELAAPAAEQTAAETKTRRLMTPVAAALFGMLLSAAAWLPVLEQVGESLRFQEVSGARDMTPPFPPRAAWTLVSPELFGNPARGNWSWVLNYSVVASSYAGLLTLAFLPSAFSRRANRRDRLLVVAAVVLFLMAMNWTPLARLLNAIPPLSIVANDKIRFFTTLLAAMIAARALTRIERGFIVPALAGSLAVAAIAMEGLLRKHEVTVGASAFVGVAGLVFFWVFVFVSRRTDRPRMIPWAAAVVIMLELFVLNIPFNALVDGRLYRPHLPIIDAIHRLSPGEPFRVVGVDWVLMPQSSAEYGVEDIRGSDPMASASSMNFFSLIEAEDDSHGVKRVQNLAQPGVDFLNVRFGLAEPGFVPPEGWAVVYEGSDGVLLENRAWMRRFFAPQKVIRETSLSAQLPEIDDFRQTVTVEGVGVAGNASPEGLAITQPRSGKFRLRVTTSDRTFLASSQPFSPGWKLFIDGDRSEMHQVNGAFIGFFVPSGEHEVELIYRPTSFVIGGVLGIMAIVIGMFLPRARGDIMEKK